MSLVFAFQHLALTDFGLSKQNIDSSGGATTFCGERNAPDKNLKSNFIFTVYLFPDRFEWLMYVGVVIGTAEYIAPELLKAQKYGPAVDWWSFGILL